MFGARYFGARHWGGRYWGRGSTSPLLPDLLATIVAYLRTAPTVVAVLPLDSKGRTQVYDEDPPAATDRPYLVLTGYTETFPGDSLEDHPCPVTIEIYTSGLDQARAVADTIRASLDGKNANPNSVRRARFAWTGGTENYCLRNESQPRKTPGLGRGGQYVFREQIMYQFVVNARV